MIVLDASAVVAILNREPGFEQLLLRMLHEPQRHISPVSFVEVVMALARKFADPRHVPETWVKQENVQIFPVEGDHASWALHGYLIYGKGRHPARLNLGDCFSYAAAKALDAPLLYVGDDFAKTDIRPA